MSLARLLRRRPSVPFREWGSEIKEARLPREGIVEYARWLHPLDRTPAPTQEEVDGLRQFIRPGDFAIDVGAYTGDTALAIALAAGPSGAVLALEPNRYVYKILERNASLNPGRTRIIPRCFAATEGNSTFTFHYSDPSFCNGGAGAPSPWKLLKRRYPLEVQGKNLLAVLYQEFGDLLPRLSFIKVDAEGFDRSVLASIQPVIAKYKPTIRAEVFRKLSVGERQSLFELLASSGHRVHRYEGGASPAGRLLAAGDMGHAKHFDVLAIHPAREARAAA